MSNAIHEVFVYLCVKDADAAVDFYSEAFGATEIFRLTEPSGRIGHIELNFGETIVMLSEEFPELEVLAPKSSDNHASQVHLHVENCDKMAESAISNGARMINEPQDHFYGERSCKLEDPFGHLWLIGHTIEKVTPEEMQCRYTALFTQ